MNESSFTDIIENFSAIILDFNTSTEGVSGLKEIGRCQIIFVDNSRLVVYTCKQPQRFKYIYQWMNPQNQTLYRWDNTPHFPNFSTFPFHRHIGEDETAEPFQFVSLEDILIFISNKISLTC